MHPLPASMAAELHRAKVADAQRRRPGRQAHAGLVRARYRSAQRAIGWFLVHLGLRLAAPRPTFTPSPR